ncbi:hypothetical protein IAR50_002278 [Cryptococcus sp. DSM 104548]
MSEGQISTDPPTQAYHEGFQKGDVYLLSSDNVLFAIDCYRLIAVSDIFEDMFDIPPPYSASSSARPPQSLFPSSAARQPFRGDPIEVNLASAHLACFFEFAFLSGDRAFPLKVDELRVLLPFCQRQSVKRPIYEKMLKQLEQLPKAGPGASWDAFIIASLLKEPSVATIALKHIPSLKDFLHGAPGLSFSESLSALENNWGKVIIENMYKDPKNAEYMSRMLLYRRKDDAERIDPEMANIPVYPSYWSHLQADLCEALLGKKRRAWDSLEIDPTL